MSISSRSLEPRTQFRLCGFSYYRCEDGRCSSLPLDGLNVDDQIERPRVRTRADGAEMAQPSWEARAEDWLGRWATNLMLINVSTRRFGRAVRLPEGDIAAAGSGVSESAVVVAGL